MFILLEHCQWGEWSSWKWDKKVKKDGKSAECNNGDRIRTKIAEARHGGIECDGLLKDTKFNTCPGNYLIRTDLKCIILFYIL